MAGRKSLAPGFAIVALCATGGLTSAQTGGVTGKVIVRGTVPQPASIDMSDVRFCHDAHGRSAPEAGWEIDRSGSVGDAVVYIKEGIPGRPLDARSPTAAEVVLDQRACLYEPSIVVLRTGQPLVIRNSDATLHNVHVVARRNRGFNIGQPFAGLEARRTFDVPEIGIEVRCDIHGWMHASIAVFDHEYFASSEANGNFTIEDLPPGEYVIVAWHPALGTVESVVVVGDGTTEITLAFQQ